MIYVSSSCVKADTIKASVLQLHQQGYTNIELSGGTQRYEALEDDLLELKAKHNLNYLCHNYFPPPPEDFVLNIASLDEEVSEKSVNHILEALALSRKLGAKKYAFHAGFLINIPVSEIGQRIQQRPLFDREEAREQFCNNYIEIINQTEGVELYVENNVLSHSNYESYQQINPFFITDFEGFEEFKELIDIKPLIDVAHLKVSAQSLGLNAAAQLDRFIAATDYIHISDNDGLHDTNQTFSSNSELFSWMSKHDYSDKTITLEVYSGPEALRESYEATQLLLAHE